MRELNNKDIFELCLLAHQSQEGHLGSSLSILDILNVIYSIKDSLPLHFILSKGHASLGLYVILRNYGYITDEQLYSFCKVNSTLGGHPDFKKVPGIYGSTGSLGHGLPMAIGKALGLRSSGSDKRVVVLVGDGEMNEGSNWEAILLGAHHQLDNLTCIVDFNKSSERALTVKKIPGAVEHLGWRVLNVDGHNQNQIASAIKDARGAGPVFIWAHTIKGKGISFMENNPEWHHKFPSANDLLIIKKELGLA